jgi:deoxycytidine triphosphate deaminase
MIHIQSFDSASYLTNVQQVDIQPNAVDLRIDKVFEINRQAFLIDEDKKVHRGSVEIQPDKDGYWELKPGTYEIVMENIITVGEGEAGWVITRSTLNRNGIFITSGLYDSGYQGVMAGAMHVNCGPMFIKKGTRVGQFLLFKSETLKLYDGDYGLNKAHDQKYTKE